MEDALADRSVQLEWEMEASTWHSLFMLLQECWDVFTFGPKEMAGIDPAIMEHKLNIVPLHKAVIQKKRHMGPERAVVATAEGSKLLKAGFVREC